MDRKLEIVYLSVDVLDPMESNPNKQSDAIFNNLVENIQEIGMVEPIMVAPKADEPGRYKIVSGYHRYEACRVLDYEEVPCVVQHDFDEDMSNFQLVRMNVLKGKLDPVKFTKLYDQMAEKYGDELTKIAMGLVDEKAFESLYVRVREELPPELQEKMDEAKDDIKTVDDLSRILNAMFTEYGNTLDSNFMVFQYGGKSHLWVRMNKELNTLMLDDLMPQLHDAALDVNDFFNTLISTYGTEVMEAMTKDNDGGVNLFAEEAE